MKQLILDLWLVPGLGPVKIRKIIDALMPAVDTEEWDEPARREVLTQVCAQFSVKGTTPAQIIELAEKERELLEKHQISWCTFRCEEYPPLLKEIHSPPAVLFYKGSIDCLSQTCIAIVGSRKNSPYASRFTEKLTEELSQKIPYVTIISGLAYGIDSVAHRSALKAELKTSAVLGSGIFNIYPPSNTALAQQIIETGGCILTELPCTSAPLSVHFPLRNRIISGLSKTVLIMEAGEKSGSLITARYALEQNRDVFALPGQADNLNFFGCNRLIQQSRATLLMSADDIIRELLPESQRALFESKPASEKDYSVQRTAVPPEVTDPDEIRILTLLSEGELHEEIMAEKLEIGFQELVVKLTGLEIMGYTARGNGTWQRVPLKY